MGQRVTTCAAACPAGAGAGSAPIAVRGARLPRVLAAKAGSGAGAGTARRAGSAGQAAGRAEPRSPDMPQPGRFQQISGTCRSSLGLTASETSAGSEDTFPSSPDSGFGRQTSAQTAASSSSFSSWVDSLKAQEKRRVRSEAEVRNFLQAHGFSDVNQLRQTSRWCASSACRPLHVAVSLGDKTIVQLLLLHGADPTLPDAAGCLPGHRRGARSKTAQCSSEEREEARRAVKAAAARSRKWCEGRRSQDRLLELFRRDPLLDGCAKA
ncbi:unnamed protein product [Prorocentrum cordatum]|uniref:Uncharacterized protein n=2 Tax=Prorocentrum cordatum TaxID=2364126 RepID=A0ABN9WD09_9DINO|nr:unnamed protein product [Polarella glacialis]